MLKMFKLHHKEIETGCPRLIIFYMNRIPKHIIVSQIESVTFQIL